MALVKTVSTTRQGFGTTVAKIFGASASIRDQIDGSARSGTGKTQTEMDLRRKREKDSSDAMLEFYGARPPPGQFFESS